MVSDAQAKAESDNATGIEKHYRVCNFCEAMCGVQVTLAKTDSPKDKDIVVKPDPLDPFSKGSMCPKAPVLAALQTDPSRLRQPVKKVDENWAEISWEEAYSTIEDNLKRIRSEHGNDAIASYLGNPIVHNLGMMLFVKTLTQAIGSKNVFSATSMDQLPHHFAAHYMFGHEFRIPVPDIDRTDFIIIMGANPIASNGSIMTSAGVRERLQRIEQRGGQFVVIDPRKTETAAIATAHHFINPATDVFFLLAFLHVLVRDEHIYTGRLTNHILGLEQLEHIAQQITPEIAATLTGICADTIVQLATDYAKCEKAVLYGRMGLSTQPHGGLCHWLINSINIVSGHFDTPGGMMFPSPAIELARHKQKNLVGRWVSRVRQMPEFYGELPVSAMTEELTTKGNGQVRAFMSVCGNPVLSTPGGHRLDAALPNMEFMFSIDNYINETTRHADIILPSPSGLEVDHYDLIFNLISVANNAKFSEALLPTGDDRPYDWQILKELIKRLSPNGGGIFHKLQTPRRIINWGLMLGAYGRLSHPSRWFSGLSLKKVIDSKHGVSLGPLVPRIPQGLLTLDRKIHLAPSVFVDHVKQVLQPEHLLLEQSKITDRERFAFSLIGRRHVSTNNSWMHQFRKLSVSKQVRCTAMISLEDAERLEIADEDQIKVSSVNGEISLPVEVTETMKPGVVCIPHGFGHARAGTRIPHADAKPGVSVNDITDHNHVDELTGNAAFSGTTVTIEKIAASASSKISKGKPLLVLFGSRTGNAEFIAREIVKDAMQHEMFADVVAMDEIELEKLVEFERLLIVCSTYGEGDMPDNAQGLWDKLQQSDAPRLEDTYFSVLAFGDTSYETFCEAGKKWDRRLEELGATRIAPRVDCDVDYIDAASAWVDHVLPDISVIGDQTLVKLENQKSSTNARAQYNRSNPLAANVRAKHLLTASDSSKETWHIELSLDDKDIDYVPGDTLNVLPINRDELVQELLDIMSNDGSVQIQGSTRTVREQLTNTLELRLPSQALLKIIETQSPHEQVRSLFTEGNQQALENYLWGKDIVDLLVDNRGAVDEMDTLLSVLRPIAPRSYSIASSLNAHPSAVHLTVAAVRYDSNERHHNGAGSCYLADIASEGSKVNVYFAPASSFVLPENDDTPIIMIGPGTGLAPFRGFLQERHHRLAPGDNWLFFGDRQAATDFLYQDELSAFVESGLLTRLDLAFSRDQQEKIYVQHRMHEHSTELYKWLQRGAYIYVCGDAKHMANDVDIALHSIVQKEAAMSSEQAKKYVTELKHEKRYLRDVY